MDDWLLAIDSAQCPHATSVLAMIHCGNDRCLQQHSVQLGQLIHCSTHTMPSCGPCPGAVSFCGIGSSDVGPYLCVYLSSASSRDYADGGMMQKPQIPACMSANCTWQWCCRLITQPCMRTAGSVARRERPHCKGFSKDANSTCYWTRLWKSQGLM